MGTTCPHFGKRGKKDNKAHVTTAAISGESSPGAHRDSMSHSSQKCQNKSDIQAALKRAQDENEKCKWVLDPSSIAEVIIKDVNSFQTKPDKSSSGVAKSLSYAGRPYMGKPRPSQLSPGADDILDSGSTCFYFKDMGHRKDNCSQSNHKLAHELQLTKGTVDLL